MSTKKSKKGESFEWTSKFALENTGEVTLVCSCLLQGNYGRLSSKRVLTWPSFFGVFAYHWCLGGLERLCADASSTWRPRPHMIHIRLLHRTCRYFWHLACQTEPHHQNMALVVSSCTKKGIRSSAFIAGWKSVDVSRWVNRFWSTLFENMKAYTFEALEKPSFYPTGLLENRSKQKMTRTGKKKPWPAEDSTVVQENRNKLKKLVLVPAKTMTKRKILCEKVVVKWMVSQMF